jgi:hypothetical protein
MTTLYAPFYKCKIRSSYTTISRHSGKYTRDQLSYCIPFILARQCIRSVRIHTFLGYYNK